MQIGINLALTQRNGGAGAPALNIDFAGTGVLPSTVTFSRGTNATLTDSNGRVAWAPHNLLVNSEDFEAAGWVKVGSTVTANATTAPDGTTTADKLVEDTSTGVHVTTQNVAMTAGVSYTFSIFVKAAERSRLFFERSNATLTAFTALVDLSTGTVVSTTGSVTAAVTLAGSGFYRVTLTVLAASTASGGVQVDLVSTGSTTNYTGDGTSGLFIWGAQLNVGSTAQSYNSTTPKNLLGFTQEPENAAWTKSNSYVQQNLLTWSQDFDNAAWTRTVISSVVANAAVAPDGTTTAYLVTSGGNVLGSQLYQIGIAISNGAQYTATCYFKAGTSTWAILNLYDTVALNKRVWFNLSNGTVGTQDAGITGSIQSVGNGFYRCSVTRAVSSASGGVSVEFSDADGSVSVTVGRNMTVWGAQLVQGSTAGDYTQTTSAAAPTRYLNWDGTLTGRKLVEDTVNAFHGVYTLSTLVAGTRYTQSVYAKAGERQWMMMAEGNNVTASAWFNLSTGVVGTVSGTGTPTATITNVGGGWYRCSLSYTPIANAGNTQARATTGDNVSTYTGDGTSGIYVSDFQLSNSASVDPYVYNPQAAAASAAYYGPRFDFDPVTLAAKGLLIEEQRTNLLTYSEQFDNAVWMKTNATVTANTVIAPDGTLTGDKLIADTTASAVHRIQVQPTTATATAYALSVYAKAGEQGFVAIRDVSLGISVWFNLTTGAVATANPGIAGVITSVGNGWYRCVALRTTATTNTLWAIGGSSADAVTTYTGDGFSGIYIWGAQLEAGSFATSYIPTVASQVTRNADSASMLGDNFYSWFNPNQGTLSAEVTPYGVLSDTRVASLQGTNNRILIWGGTTSNQARYEVITNGSTEVNLSINNTFIANATTKAASAYKVNDFAFSANGGAVVTDTSGQVPVNITVLNIGGSTGVPLPSGAIRRINYYNTRLPDSTLQAMTT